MPKGIEELSVLKIKSGIRAIKNKTKTPKDANCGVFFSKLKKLNIELHDDLMNTYSITISKYNRDNKENY